MGLGLSGCTTVSPDEEILNEYGDHDGGPDSGADGFPEPERSGIYHKVAKGETLWRIAKTYGVSITDIISTNNIPDVAQIETDQLVFIPGADAMKQIVVEEDEKANEFIWPVEGGQVAKYFNQPEGSRRSRGINIKADPGKEVVASRSGRVVFADHLPGYGRTLILDHEDGYHSVYAHNGDLLVGLNDAVAKRTPIALVGRDGAKAFMHFEIRRNATAENPLFYLP